MFSAWSKNTSTSKAVPASPESFDVSFSDQEIAMATGYEARGDYPGMYRYLTTLTGAGESVVAERWIHNQWFRVFAEINEGHTDLAKEVRAVAYRDSAASESPITAAIYQQASDRFAHDFLRLLQAERGLHANHIVDLSYEVIDQGLGLSGDAMEATVATVLKIKQQYSADELKVG